MSATTGGRTSSIEEVVSSIAEAAAAMVKAGAVRTVRRVARGYVMFVPDMVYLLTAQDYPFDPDAPASKEANDRLILRRAAVQQRRRWLIGAVLAVGAWMTGGWLTLGGRECAIINAALICTGIIAGTVAYKSAKVTWQQAAPWVAAPVASMVSLWVHVEREMSILQMSLIPLGLHLLWVVYAAGPDGSSRDNVSAAEKIRKVETGVSGDRIVAALAEKLGIRPDAPREKQFRIVGIGLAPVDGLWSKMTVQTPGTVTSQQVVDAMPAVASFLGISTERLDAVAAEDDFGRAIEGVVEVWVASGDQWKTPPPWPLLDVERVDAWKSVPFIVTDKGKSVTGSLLFALWLLVAKPRHGKTFAARLLALAAALDETFDLAVFDFKIGGRDWMWAKPISVASGYGRSDDTIEAFLAYLLSVLDRADELGKLFQELPGHLVPNGQLTKEACEHEPRLRPLLIVVDEVHHALMHEKHGKAITRALSKIGRELPFLGVNVAIATQRADVRTSIPSELRSLAANRVAGKLYTSRDSGDVLGDAANELGYNAKTLRDVKGLFIVHGADENSSFDGYTKGRAYYVDNVQAEAIAQRAYELRRKAGVLPGQGAEIKPPPPELLAALEIVRATGESSMLSEELASRMGTTTQKLLPLIGIKSRQEPTDGWRKHVYLDDLQAAVTRHGRALRAVS